MARLVSVVKADGCNYAKRQMPLSVEDKLTMLLQFPDICHKCGIDSNRNVEQERFIKNFNNFDSMQRLSATSTTCEEVQEQLATLLPCVGCRRSVELLLDHVSQTGNAILDPIVIPNKGKRGQLTLNTTYREDGKRLYSLMYVHGTCLNDILDTIPRSKKNKRCLLHSLDTQKTRAMSNWLELWTRLSDECKDEILIVDDQKFMEALVVYLEKHRFCIECKTKVLHAHGLLKGDDCKKKEKGFCAALYEGVEYCKNARHIHIKNDIEFISNLITRAEPDLLGSRRERHAKTIEIAQEEVLTCLGSFLYVRFNRLLHKIKLEEQTWRQLFYISIFCLKRNFEVELEKKQGISQLELICSEIETEQRSKEHKKEMRKKKKKKSKQTKASKLSSSDFPVNEIVQCLCDEKKKRTGCLQDKLCSLKVDCASDSPIFHTPLCHVPDSNSNDLLCTCELDIPAGNSNMCHVVKGSTSDLGYSSGPEGCDSCSVCTISNSNSPDRTPNLIDRFCQGLAANARSLDQTSDEVACDCIEAATYLPVVQNSGLRQGPFHSTLQDMLEIYNEDEEDQTEVISQEDLDAYKANIHQLNRERLQLKKRLKQRFDHMIQKQRCPHYPNHH